MNSQKIFLNKIPSGCTVLILGGGTGDILAEVALLKPDCKVYYVEASYKMISLTKKKCNNLNNVHFIHGTQENIPSQLFDVVITNFYLDLFTNNTLESIILKLEKYMRPNSLWLITDFVDSKKWWQWIMLKIMYVFFRITCKIEATNLPIWSQLLHRIGFEKKQDAFFFNDFIKSELYIRKPLE